MTTSTNGTTLTIEELRKRKAARDAAFKEQDEAIEHAELLLEDTHSATLGRRGVDFEIVRTAVGCVVLRKPDMLMAKRFNAVPSDKRAEEEVIQFVAPCVVSPDTMAFRTLMVEHGGIAWRCATALLHMYGAEDTARTGKF